MQAVRPILRGLVLRNAPVSGVVARNYGGHEHHQAPTLNDLPVPCGDWQEEHNRQNRKYNTVLAVGIAFFLGTLSFVKSAGLIHLNYSPPKSIE